MWTRNTMLASAIAALLNGGSALAQSEYTFTLVDAFTINYGLRECYIYDISDQNVAVGTATIQNGSMITYTGFYWTAADEKTPVGLSWPRGVNNNGLMAGVTQLYDIPTGQFTNMPLLPATYYPLVMLDSNDSGTAVGYVHICNCSNSQGFLQIPYVWVPGDGARSLAVTGANGAAKINNNGLIVGWTGGWGASNGYVYDLNAETYFLVSTLFDGPNVQTTAVDVNDNNVVLGSRKNSNGTINWGYTWSAETGVTLLPLPPAGYQPYLKPASINDSGVVVGAIYTPQASSRAFVYDKAHGVRDLNTLTVAPNFTLMTATAVNDNGWIVGYGYGGGGMYKSFVLVPIVTGDCNSDGVVNVDDLLAIINAWGKCGDPCPEDLNQNGFVDVDDLLIVINNWS